MDKTLVVCSTDKPILVSRGVPSEKIIIHLNGVDRPKIAWENRNDIKAKIRAEWNIHPALGEKVYGIVARLAKEKDHELALRIITKTRDLSFKVLCFGVGPEELRLKKLTAKLGLQDKVLWMGYRKTLGQELAGFDGLLSFSKAEGLPINLIEAGWASTPIFARLVDGVADLIPSNEFGRCFAKDAREELIEKEFRSFYQSSGEKEARAMLARVEKDFSGKTWANKMDEIIKSIK